MRSGLALLVMVLLWTGNAAAPLVAQGAIPRIDAIVSAAHGGDPAAACGWASIYGTNLSTTMRNADGQMPRPFPEELDGVTVEVGGVKAPLHFVSPNQINFQVPCALGPGTHRATLTTNGQRTDYDATIALGHPSVFQAGRWAAAQRHPDYKLVGLEMEQYTTARARPDDILIAYLTGLTPPPGSKDGQPAGTDAEGKVFYRNDVTATLGGEPVDVIYAARNPYFIALDQFAFRVPKHLGTGIYELRISEQNRQSQPVAIPVQASEHATAGLIRTLNETEATFDGVSKGQHGELAFKTMKNAFLIPTTGEQEITLTNDKFYQYRKTTAENLEHAILHKREHPDEAALFKLEWDGEWLQWMQSNERMHLRDSLRRTDAAIFYYGEYNEWHTKSQIPVYFDMSNAREDMEQHIPEILAAWGGKETPLLRRVDYDPIARGEQGIRLRFGEVSNTLRLWNADKTQLIGAEAQVNKLGATSWQVLVLKHEIGHALGLSHSPHKRDIMHASPLTIIGMPGTKINDYELDLLHTYLKLKSPDDWIPTLWPDGRPPLKQNQVTPIGMSAVSSKNIRIHSAQQERMTPHPTLPGVYVQTLCTSLDYQ